METEDLCTACLCSGRALHFINESGLYKIYSQILNEIPIEHNGPQLDIRVCFECRGRLRAFHLFRERAKTSYCHLLQYTHQNTLKKCTISKPPQLQIFNTTPTAYPLLTVEVVKDESLSDQTEVKEDAIKSEPQDFDASDHADYADHHSEPETFVNQLVEINEARPPKKTRKNKNTKTRLKKVKEKTKRAKRKRKTEAPSESSDGLSDMDSLVDLYTDGKDTMSKKSKTNKVTEEEADDDVKVVTLTLEELMQEREGQLRSPTFLQRAFRCNDCITSFDDEDALTNHLERLHSEAAGAHPCGVCAQRFPRTRTLHAHSAEHARRYVCGVCGRRGTTRADVRQHARTHALHTCALCGLHSGSLSKHQAHMSKVHQEKPQCAECGKMFSSRKTYRYHLNVIHKGQNRFPCPQCGKVYQWKSNLWRHIKNHKARASGELYCALCDKKFSSVATYQQHLKISRRHVSEKDYTFACSECGQKFVNKTRLKDHVDWEHLKKINYRCQLCNKPFKSNTSLYVHVQNVHKNKAEKDNLCHVCGKSYQNIAKLKYHIVAMHTGETPYSCAHCPSTFSWYSSLYRHVREVHDKVKLKKPKKNRKENEVLPSLIPVMMGPGVTGAHVLSHTQHV